MPETLRLRRDEEALAKHVLTLERRLARAGVRIPLRDVTVAEAFITLNKDEKGLDVALLTYTTPPPGVEREVTSPVGLAAPGPADDMFDGLQTTINAGRTAEPEKGGGRVPDRTVTTNDAKVLRRAASTKRKTMGQQKAAAYSRLRKRAASAPTRKAPAASPKKRAS